MGLEGTRRLPIWPGRLASIIERPLQTLCVGTVALARPGTHSVPNCCNPNARHRVTLRNIKLVWRRLPGLELKGLHTYRSEDCGRAHHRQLIARHSLRLVGGRLRRSRMPRSPQDPRRAAACTSLSCYCLNSCLCPYLLGCSLFFLKFSAVQRHCAVSAA